MPEIAFVEIDGVEEEEYFSNVKDQEGKLLVLQFDHDVSKEVDPLDCSKVRSDRHHGAASILTYQGKSTPELNKLLCEGGNHRADPDQVVPSARWVQRQSRALLHPHVQGLHHHGGSALDVQRLGVEAIRATC